MLSNERSITAQETHPYRTAQSIALTSSLSNKWQGTKGDIPLIDIIQQWRIAYSIPIWLDRRIANDDNVTTSDACETVGDSIAEVAKQIRSDIAQVDGVMMLVPEGLGVHFENTYWSLASVGIPAVWLRSEDPVLTWDEGAVARDVLQSFVARYRVEGFSPDQIEHDVWPAASWANTTPLVVAIGLLGSFDLKPILSGKSISVNRIDPGAIPAEGEWVYRDEISMLGKDRWQHWRARWKNAKVRRIDLGGKPAWSIKAPASAHRELVAPLAPPPKKSSPWNRSKTRYTGRYRGELQSILQSLAGQTKLDLILPELSPSILRQELDLVFEQATLEEVVERISSASGLHLQLNDKELRVLAP